MGKKTAFNRAKSRHVTMKNAPEKQTQNRPEEQKTPCKVCIRNVWPKKIKANKNMN